MSLQSKLREMAGQILTPSSKGKHFFNECADKLDRLTTENSEAHATTASLTTQLFAATKENEGLRKDFQWLEENANDTAGLTIGGICYWSITKGKKRIGEGDDLRGAIADGRETAMQKTKGEG